VARGSGHASGGKREREGVRANMAQPDQQRRKEKKKHKGDKQHKPEKLVKTPVWQALACLSWLKDIVIIDTLQPGAKVCEFNFKGGQDITKWAKAGVATLQGVDRNASSVAKAKEIAKKLRQTKMTAQYDMFDPLHQDMHDMLPPASFDCVACFNDAHLMMESFDTLNRFLSNAAYILKSTGLLTMLVHDGAHIWSLMQKETPEGDLAPDFKPVVKRKLFSLEMSELLGAKQKNPKTVGVRYRLHIKKEGQLDPASKSISLSANEAYLMHDRTLVDCAASAGLYLVSMINCDEYVENYHSVHPETMKKKLTQSSMMKEQREVVQLFAFAIFQKK